MELGDASNCSQDIPLGWALEAGVVWEIWIAIWSATAIGKGCDGGGCMNGDGMQFPRIKYFGIGIVSLLGISTGRNNNHSVL
jgi:hypothetical protein